jgi:hypothetical protein
MTARHPPNAIPHLDWVQYIGIISVALGMLKCTLKTPTLVHFRRENDLNFRRVQRQKWDEFTSKISISTEGRRRNAHDAQLLDLGLALKMSETQLQNERFVAQSAFWDYIDKYCQ